MAGRARSATVWVAEPADWTRSVKAIDTLDGATRDRLRVLAQPASAPAGTRIFDEGSPCGTYLFVLSGQVLVRKTGENGREIVLYRVGPGETCVVTTACLMTGTDYDAEGIAETDIQAEVLPIGGFRELMASSATFRDFVFRAFGTRIGDLLMLIEEVAFGRIDQRLAARLLERTYGADVIEATHQELAVELGTAREVISRQLKDFEHRGFVALARGQVRIADRAGLERLARK
jgi:CRP/FNR family transcriptional regulator